jgi:hypothetical protein
MNADMQAVGGIFGVLRGNRSLTVAAPIAAHSTGKKIRKTPR